MINYKHYDAECPEGVYNIFDLPIFARVTRKHILELKYNSE